MSRVMTELYRPKPSWTALAPAARRQFLQELVARLLRFWKPARRRLRLAQPTPTPRPLTIVSSRSGTCAMKPVRTTCFVSHRHRVGTITSIRSRSWERGARSPIIWSNSSKPDDSESRHNHAVVPRRTALKIRNKTNSSNTHAAAATPICASNTSEDDGPPWRTTATSPGKTVVAARPYCWNT
jgi:hypothetical protein